MDAVKRENRVLRSAVVVLFCGLAAGAAMSGQDKGQRVPGPGSGVVPIKLADEAMRVVQHGDWKVGVQGTVEMVPSMPPVFSVGRTYEIQWDQATTEVVTLRELHGSGWARVEGRGERWMNLTQARTIALSGR